MSLFHPPALRALHATNLPIKTLTLYTWAPTILQFTTNLESLTIEQITVFYRVPSLPNLKTLKIRRTFLSLGQLKNLFSACTGGLQSFEYDTDAGNASYQPFLPRLLGNRFPAHWANYESTDLAGVTNDEIYGPTPPGPSGHITDVIECLKGHCKSLTSLHLDLRYQWTPPEPIPILKEFVALQNLFLSLPLLGRVNAKSNTNSRWLVDVLPPSIESLYLTSSVPIDPELSDLELRKLVDVKQKTPESLKLKQIKWQRYQDEPRSSLVDMFTTIGVDFKYDILPYPSMGIRIPRATPSGPYSQYFGIIEVDPTIGGSFPFHDLDSDEDL